LSRSHPSSAEEGSSLCVVGSRATTIDGYRNDVRPDNITYLTEKDYGRPCFHAATAANLILSRAILRIEIEAETNALARILYFRHIP
jgi:hypothetical protein